MQIPKQSATVQQIVDFYIASPAFFRLSRRSQQDYLTNLEAVCNTVVKGRRLGDVRNANVKASMLIQAYEQWLESGVRTANYRRSVLSTAWKHAMRHDVMIHNPVSLVKTVASQPRQVRWEKEHVKKFLDVAYSDFRWRSIGLLVHMAYDWGQRVGDMRMLTWDKLDLDQCRMDMTQSKRNAEVHLPISNGLCAMLRQQRDDFQELSEYVAPRTKAKAGRYSPYLVREVGDLVNEVLDAADLPRELCAMDLRRTAVTEMVEGGADQAAIRQVTGHKDIKSLNPYMVNTFSGASRALSTRGNDND